MSGSDRDDVPARAVAAPDLVELTEILLATADVERALGELAAIAAQITPDVPMAGVTLQHAGQVLTVASSDAHALMIDEVQYDLGEQGGPCLTAISTGQIVLVEDVAGEHRWGTYSAQMLAHGVRSIYSHPLLAREQAIAALNMYSPRPGRLAFTAPVRHAIGVTARHTGLLLHAVMRAAQQATLTDQLRQALAHREVIHQAMGIIMAQQRCTSRQAFDILRRASQNRNRRLFDIAADIVQSITGRPAEAAPFVDPEA